MIPTGRARDVPGTCQGRVCRMQIERGADKRSRMEWDSLGISRRRADRGWGREDVVYLPPPPRSVGESLSMSRRLPFVYIADRVCYCCISTSILHSLHMLVISEVSELTFVPSANFWLIPSSFLLVQGYYCSLKLELSFSLIEEIADM